MRAVVALAIRSGISVREWVEGDERALDTALELLTENQPTRSGGPQMSG